MSSPRPPAEPGHNSKAVKDAKGCPAPLDLTDETDQVLYRAGQPVELGHDQHVTRPLPKGYDRLMALRPTLILAQPKFDIMGLSCIVLTASKASIGAAFTPKPGVLRLPWNAQSPCQPQPGEARICWPIGPALS